MQHSASIKTGAAMNGASLNGASKIPAASFMESLFYNRVHVIPYYRRGIFTPDRARFSEWAATHPDPAAVEFMTGMRRKHGSRFYLYMMTTRSLVLLDLKCIRRVLDNSPEIYADAKLKRVGMSHFQPNSVTISRGEEWRERRRFNEAVLKAGNGVHQYAGQFLAVIRDETATALQQAGEHLAWDDFDRLFQKIALKIIFGEGADVSLAETLRKMMCESNRGFALGKSRYFDGFYAKVRRGLLDARDSSLASLCHSTPSAESTKVENQIPHWMFAMGETLATNTARALALIVAHPAAEARVRQEMGRADISSAHGINQLPYLEGCVQEAMRLWPTTPILVRETVKEDVLGGETIPAGTQVIIPNSFIHRDRETISFADTFSPELWMNSPADYPDYCFNHLSNGSQVCAGKGLALFIAKSVLANLLAARRHLLQGPLLDPLQPLPHAYNHFALRFTSASGA